MASSVIESLRLPLRRAENRARRFRSTSAGIRVWGWCDRNAGFVILAAAVLTGLVFAVNLAIAPDFNVDETLYAMAGQNVLHYDAVSFGTDPIRVHPPLFFITLAGWLHLTGHGSSSVLEAIHVARFLNVLFDVGIVTLSAILCRSWTTGRTLAQRNQALIGVVLLVAFSALVQRFGRLVLIDPMAVFFSLLAVAIAWRLRNARAPTYVFGVGAMIGVALLVKQTAIFILLAPAVAALLQARVRRALRDLAALLVGFVIWTAFPLWEATNGDWTSFFHTQTLSVRRLLGTAQVSGLNRAHVSPTAALFGTLWQFIGSYITFAVGGFVLCAAARRLIKQRSRAFDDQAAQIVGLGVSAYFFLVYCLGIGLSNEQLTIYAVPASALLAVSYSQIRLPDTRPQRTKQVLARVIVTVVVLSLAIGVVNWARLFAFGRDDATARMESFIEQNVAVCVPINSTGDPFHWASTLRTNPITSFSDGPPAVAFGVHLFLISPKDVEFHYGNSTQQLTDFVHSHGQLVYRLSSHTSDEISLWQVGTPSVAVNARLPDCVPVAPVPDKPAPAGRFLLIVAGLLGLDALAMLLCCRWVRQRSRRRYPGSTEILGVRASGTTESRPSSTTTRKRNRK